MRDFLIILGAFTLLNITVAIINWIGDNFSNVLGPIGLIGLAAGLITTIVKTI